MSSLPKLETIKLARRGRVLSIMLNRPEALNAFNAAMHVEIIDALRFADRDPDSDVIVLTGAGAAFSAGGDLARMEEFIASPGEFDREAADAKRLVFALLDIVKPVIARLPGHAVGLGATIALLCDIIFAADTAKIGDPHVRVGLVAGDGGCVIWPQLIGFARAKEFLFTGDLLTAPRAAELGLINRSCPLDELDEQVDRFCDRLAGGAIGAIQGTKATINLELKRIAHQLMDPGIAYESLSVRSDEYASAIKSAKAQLADRGKSRS